MQDVDLCKLISNLKARVQSNRKRFAALERKSINRNESTNALTFNSIRCRNWNVFGRRISMRGAEMSFYSECAPTAKMSSDGDSNESALLPNAPCNWIAAIYWMFAPVP